MAASKIIHFIVGERSEKAEFMNDAKVEDLKGNFDLVLCQEFLLLAGKGSTFTLYNSDW